MTTEAMLASKYILKSKLLAIDFVPDSVVSAELGVCVYARVSNISILNYSIE